MIICHLTLKRRPCIQCLLILLFVDEVLGDDALIS